MSGLQAVNIRRRLRLADYDRFNRGTASGLRRLACPLSGRRVMHVNATARGGGVVELLQSQVPFERALELESRWYALKAPPEFFRVTKHLHNLLQGKAGDLTKKEKDIYLTTNQELGRSLARAAASFRPDLVVVHDPQPLPAAGGLQGRVPVISRLHIDLLTPNPRALELLRPFLEAAGAVVVSSRDYAGNLPWVPGSRKPVILPAIDPLSNKNKDVSAAAARRVLRGLGVDVSRPVMSQVSRFDPWKDPVGVVDAYRLAKKKIPGLQLVLAGLFLAADDPEAARVLRQVRRRAKGDSDIFLFSEPHRLRHVSVEAFVGAVYAASDIVVQKSVREGFGLTMTEAMWKGKPLVAGRTTGALAQVRDGVNGLVVSSPQQAASAVVRLMRDDKLRARLGRAARESVRRRFLMPRFVADNLKLYRKILG